MSSAMGWVKSAMISIWVMPSAIIPTAVATGIRVPRMQGTPAMAFWSAMIRSNPMAEEYRRQLPARGDVRHHDIRDEATAVQDWPRKRWPLVRATARDMNDTERRTFRRKGR